MPTNLVDFIAMHVKIRDVEAHLELQNDIIEYLWKLKGEAT
jgi:hypothetical protein